MNMKLTFLGTGSAFTLNNYQSNMLLDVNGAKLLIDCGGDSRHALKELGLTYKDINAVYISHLHADHIGGLEWLAFCTYFDPFIKHRYPMFINEHLARELWDTSLKGGLGSIQNKITTLETYFDVRKVPKNETFTFAGLELRVIQTVHVMDGYTIVPSYGLMWKTPTQKTVFLTTDTQFAPNQIKDFYKTADIIFHDCETAKFRSDIHAHYEDLKTLPPEIKRKMWLYHYQDGDLPDAIADGFQGFVAKGQIFDFSVTGDFRYTLEEAKAAEMSK